MVLPSTSAPDVDDASGTPPEEFDRAYYLAMNPDVDAAGLEAWTHYHRLGWREGRDPADWFSTSAYLDANPDVAEAGKDPFVHYIVAGRSEGRRLSPRVSDSSEAIDETAGLEPVRAVFDAAFYGAAYPDIDLNPDDAFKHYLFTGWREGRDPCRWFSTRGYLDANLDVEQAGQNPFVHYVLTGRYEGRPLSHDLGFRFDLVRKAAEFDRIVQGWVVSPAKPADDPAILKKALADVRSRRLHLTTSHDDFTSVPGGVQLCIKLEARGLAAAGIPHLHLFPSNPGPVVDIDRPSLPVGVLLDGVFLGYFAPEQLADVVTDVFDGAAITLAIHSLIGFHIDALASLLTRIRPERSFYWLHDFSSLCANFNLMRNNAVFCGAPPPESLACEICAYGSRRRIQLDRHLQLFNLLSPTVMAPSESALTIWRQAFPVKQSAAVIRPHARLVKATEQGVISAARNRSPSDPLRIGFLGMPSSHKGWPVFGRLVRHFSDDERYTFFHLSKEADSTVPAKWLPVSPTPTDPIPMPDAVRRSQLDAVVIWSLCQETFGFAAYEAVAGGAIVLTNRDAGNVRDMVFREGFGAVFEGEYQLHEAFADGSIFHIISSIELGDNQIDYADDAYYDRVASL